MELYHADGALNPIAEILKRAVPIALDAIYGRIGHGILLHLLWLAGSDPLPTCRGKILTKLAAVLGSSAAILAQGPWFKAQGLWLDAVRYRL